MRFVFKARDQKGEIQKGIIESGTKDMAVDVLSGKGMIPISVEQEKKAPKIIVELQRALEGASQKDKMMLFRQLSTLIAARVPIVYSLRAVAEQTTNRYLTIVTKEIADDVEDGTPFSESLTKYPDVFSPIIYSTIHAGEVSGNLHNSIKFVADNIEKNYRLTSKIRGALFYPAFVIIASIILGFVTTVVVLPRLTQVIEDMQVEVPWYTKLVIATGDFMSVYWWAVLIIILAAIGSFIYYVKSEAGKREWDHVKLKIPIVGKLFQYIYLARFATNLSMLMAGGISIVKSLAIVADVVNNSVYKAIILRSADEVRAGGDISDVFFESKDMPPLVSRMIKIGEETGKTNESLDAIAGFYEAEADDLVKNLTSMIEPILIVILGVGVAFLVFSVLLPIYNIADQF